MNEFLIKLVGIVMMVSTPMGDAPNGKHVVIPRWEAHEAHGGKEIHPHVPYIAYTTETCGMNQRCARATGWEAPVSFTCNGEKWEYLRLDSVWLTFNSNQPALTVDASYTQRIPKIRDYCPSFELDDAFKDDKTPHARKAATFDINHGTLSARGDILKDESAETWWRVETRDALTIRAIPYGGGNEKILVLQPGTKIRIGNQLEQQLTCRTDLVPTNAHDHFLVFNASLNKPTDTVCLAQPGPHSRIPDKDPTATCSNTDYP